MAPCYCFEEETMALHKRSRKCSGLTLIELLIVIIVLFVLAAILFPDFHPSRVRARQLSCMSNEKVLGIAFLQYAEDNDGRLPAGNDKAHTGVGWATEVYSYVKSAGTYTCPSDNT